MSSFGRFTQALGGVVETLTYASPLLTLTQSVGTSPLTATIPSGGISGSGTSGFIPKWTASNIIGDSIISDNGTTANILGISRVSAISPLFELFNTTNGDVWGTLQAVASSGSGSDLIFATKRNGDSLTEKLRITAVGNVGIGTTSPYQAKLDVSGINGVANIGATNSSLDQLLMGSIDRASAPAFFSLPNGSAFIGAIGNGVANTLGIGTFGASPVIFGTSNT